MKSISSRAASTWDNRIVREAIARLALNALTRLIVITLAAINTLKSKVILIVAIIHKLIQGNLIAGVIA